VTTAIPVDIRPAPTKLVQRALAKVARGEALTGEERELVRANLDALAPDLRGASQEQRARRLNVITGGPLPPVRVLPEEVPPELSDNPLIQLWQTMTPAQERGLAQSAELGRREYVAGLAGLDWDEVMDADPSLPGP
jgi:hypothetical protein